VAKTIVYTDGACRGNPGPGGWGWVVPDGPWANGFDADTTNQRMELMAVLDALRTLDGPVEVISDSTYVVNCFRDGWWKGWVRRGWKNAKKEPVANRDIWEPLIDLYRRREDQIEFTWVKGHAGDEYNDIADRLAVEAAQTGIGRTGVGRPDELGPPDELDPRTGRSPSASVAASSSMAATPGPDGTYSSVWKPSGSAVLIAGVQPPQLGGYEANPIADRVRRQLTEILLAKAELDPHLVVLTGLRLGAETLGAEAAAEAELPYVAVLPFPDPEIKWPTATQQRFRELLSEASAVVRLENKVPRDNRAAGQALDRRNGWLRTVATEAIVVWDHDEPRTGALVARLEQSMPDDVWIVST